MPGHIFPSSRIQKTLSPPYTASLKQLLANGWPRAIARNGIHLLDDWPYQFTNTTQVYFPNNPDPPQGGLFRYPYGRLRVLLPNGRERFLDIGNVRITSCTMCCLCCYCRLLNVLSPSTRHEASYQFYWVRAVLTPELLHV